MKFIVGVMTVLIPVLATSQPVLLTKNDSFKKYSYLLIGASYRPTRIGEPPSLNNIYPMECSTAFFVNENDSFYIVSAYHVLNLYDVYQQRRVDAPVNIFLIRYYDTLNQLNYYWFLPSLCPNLYKPSSYLTNPDVDCVYLPTKFENAKINIVDNGFLERRSKKRERDVIKYASYGFPSYDQPKFQNVSQYVSLVTPSYYEGSLIDNGHNNTIVGQSSIDSLYISLMPKQWEGTSGSPVFKIVTRKKKSWVEFAGVQSGKNDFFDCGYIVKKEEVSKVISNRGN